MSKTNKSEAMLVTHVFDGWIRRPSGDSERGQREGTARGDGEWGRRVGTASGDGEWGRRVGTARGDSEECEAVNMRISRVSVAIFPCYSVACGC